MAKIKIGGDYYEVPELNFLALERSWPFIAQSMISTDPIQGVSAAIHVIAAGIIEAPHFSPMAFGIREGDINPLLNTDDQLFELVTRFLKRRTLATEISGIREGLQAITREAGLEPEEGEDVKGEEEAPNPSMETLLPSSQSSLPPEQKGGAGTA